MANFENRELPVLSESDEQPYDETLHSKFQKLLSWTRSASVSIPIESYERETSLVGHSGSLYATPPGTESLLQQSIVVTGNKIEESKTDKFATFGSTGSNYWNKNYDSKNEHLLRSGQLGICNDPYCTTCPTYFKASQLGNPKASTTSDPKFHNALYGDAKGFARKLFSFCSFVSGVMNPHSKFIQQWNKVLAIFCLVAIFVDPLFFFLLYVRQDYNCIVINWRLTKALVIVRSMNDFIYFLNILLQFRLAFVSPESRVVGAGDLVDHPKKIALHYLKGYFLIDLFVVFPLPQVMLLSVLPKSLRGANYAKNVLRAAILVQYIPRLFRFLPMLFGQSSTGFIFESAWANFIINLLIFMLASHVVGSCWYLFALQRVNQCFRNACHNSNIPGCLALIDCGYGHNGHNHHGLSSILWNNNTDAIACWSSSSGGSFAYGIYANAVPLTTQTDMVDKYVYALFWGLLQISTLAGNQTPSDFVWEVLFTMAIIGLGLLLFALLIGNIQNFLQGLGRRRLEMQLRRQDVEQWMSHRRLPECLRRKVREAERYSWTATRGVNEAMLMESFPEDLQVDIRRHLFKFVKKVRIFALMDEPILDAICERLRQTTYIKGSRILSHGAVVEKMVFVVRGKLESIGEDGTRIPVAEGDACGEELLTWYLEHSSFSTDGRRVRLPGQRLLSNRTVRCLTNVEALSLRASNLEEVTILFTRFFRSSRVQGALRYESPYWRSLAAIRIQVAWRYRNKRRSYRLEMKLRSRDVEHWMNHHRIPEDLRRDMAHFEKDEVPMLSETRAQLSDEVEDSNFHRLVYRTRSASISIPMASLESYEKETSLVGHTGPLRSVRKTPFVQMSGPLYATRGTGNLSQQSVVTTGNKVVETDGTKENRRDNNDYDRKNEHLMRSGQLGMCNDPYCTTCPTYFKASQPRTRKASTIFDPEFHNNLYGDAKGFGRKLFSFCSKYVPGVMNPHAKVDNKCIAINWPMTTTLVFFRSINDLIYFFNILLQFRLAYVSPESRVVGAGDLVDHPKKIALNYLKGYFFLDVFVVFPLPQVMISFVLPHYLGLSGANYAKNLLRVAILVQYFPRLFRFLPLLIGQSPTGFIFESAWANFIINLLIFMLSGHVVGSCWYLFGLQRVNQCLRDACQNSTITECSTFIDCGLASGQKSNQWSNNVNATACLNSSSGVFTYGIYANAVQLTIETKVVNKYVFALFWGFQQISTLAGNQTPSYFVWEVLFTMAIIGLGLLLFALLIGNIQNFLQALGRRRLEMQLRGRDVEQWMSHRRLPEGLRRRVRQAERYSWAATRGVNEEMLLENLPEDLQTDIRRHLFKFIKKVRIFALMDEPILDAICERLKQKTYIKGSKILSQGGLLEKMIFVVRGKLESFGDDGTTVPLSEGDACGEELLTWYLEHSSVSTDGKKVRVPGQRLLSTRTVRCLTNVEAFSLRAADLEELTILFTRLLRKPQVQGVLRYVSPYWRSLAANRIQVAWRYRKKRLSRFYLVNKQQ
ncbi:putative cyclic nucleotide-gated ion channel 20, chloroplastic, partial [Mucuna pruriens]